jgi:general secretion pathway protein I
MRGLQGRRQGFTLLEVLVATTLMGIAVVGLIATLQTSVGNATRLTDYDRAALVARSQMDTLLLDPTLPKLVVVQQPIEPVLLGGRTGGWRARVTPFDRKPDSGPDAEHLERIELEIWWMDGERRKAFTIEAFRRGKGMQP